MSEEARISRNPRILTLYIMKSKRGKLPAVKKPLEVVHALPVLGPSQVQTTKI